jgi:hypothetical protein
MNGFRTGLQFPITARSAGALRTRSQLELLYCVPSLPHLRKGAKR